MSGWPVTPGQCPHCGYFEPFEPPELDDSGYALVCFCPDPRIAMELFVSQRAEQHGVGTCPRFRPAVGRTRRPQAERGGGRLRG